MNKEDDITVDMLRNLIANIEAGNVTTIDLHGEMFGKNRARLTLELYGAPDISIGRTGGDND